AETTMEVETVKKVRKIKRKESNPELVEPDSKDVEETTDVQVTEESRDLVQGEIEMGKPVEAPIEEPKGEIKLETETTMEVETVKKVKKIKRKESKPELVEPESKDVEETTDVQVTEESRELVQGEIEMGKPVEAPIEEPKRSEERRVGTTREAETEKKRRKIKRKEEKA